MTDVLLKKVIFFISFVVTEMKFMQYYIFSSKEGLENQLNVYSFSLYVVFRLKAKLVVQFLLL